MSFPFKVEQVVDPILTSKQCLSGSRLESFTEDREPDVFGP